MAQIRVLLVDDNATFKSAAAIFLATIEGLNVIESAGSGREALDRVRIDRPDLVLMDVDMPGMNGLEATRRVKAGEAPPKVVIMTLDDSPELRGFAHDAGADAFLSKTEFALCLPALVTRLFGASASVQ